MELLIFFIGLCLLGFLAMRFGFDSRAMPHSKEQELAEHGMMWEVRTSRLQDLRREAAQMRLVRLAGRPPYRLRRQLAFGLRALAYRLSPELAMQPSD